MHKISSKMKIHEWDGVTTCPNNKNAHFKHEPNCVKMMQHYV